MVAAVGGGVAAAYVFMHLLPELARGNEETGEVLGDHEQLSPLAALGLFVAAFVGFIVRYGLDHLAARRGSSGGIYAVHLGVYALYNALITYSLPTQFRADLPVAVLFVLAMGIHFVLSDRVLAEHHGASFRRIGRPILIAALVAGFLLAWAFAPVRTVESSAVLAILAGFVLYNVFSDELPSEDRVRFPVFAGAAGLYGVLLVVVVAFQ